MVNDNSGLVFRLDGDLDSTMAALIDELHITRPDYVHNPETLTHDGYEAPLTLR